MQSDILMFAVNGTNTPSVSMPGRHLSELGMLEVTHLEKWVVDHPEVLGDQVKVVTTQYDKWSSDSGDLARERLDVLGLDSSGQLVVVELKRGADSRIHLQAITYAALVAGFNKETLADAHADYLNRLLAEPVTPAEARQLLEEHVDGTWDDDILTVPKIILLAEDFTAQTYTTVTWLSDLTPNLNIEMHTVNAFVWPESVPAQSCIVFRRLYPVADPTTRVLTPGIAAASADSVATKIAEKKRRIRSTHLLHESNAIPEGAEIELDLHTWINADLAAAVDAWVAEDPARGRATWISHRDRPLRWAAGSNEEESSTPTTLAKRIVLEATNTKVDAIPGADVWRYKGESLAAIAVRIE
ncbi:DNA-binding protein [Mycolicibacterium mengxianglii]|uniref:DNA-binding protein n=1 Tax=Mycolicibacterium mengxianglii TaxID=2736649 RepID=UPI001E62ACF2|nr:DNA-binding protein [Mycolicibacterium mengxianglii]